MKTLPLLEYMGHEIHPYGEYFEVLHSTRKGTSPLFGSIQGAQAYIEICAKTPARGPHKQGWPEVVSKGHVVKDYVTSPGDPAHMIAGQMARDAAERKERALFLSIFQEVLGEGAEAHELRRSGNCWTWYMGGKHFELQPVTADAKGRKWRLHCNGEPARGGQYHYNIESAFRRAAYCAECTYFGRIEKLEQQVNALERELDEARRATIKVGPYTVEKSGLQWSVVTPIRRYDVASDWEGRALAQAMLALKLPGHAESEADLVARARNLVKTIEECE